MTRAFFSCFVENWQTVRKKGQKQKSQRETEGERRAREQQKNKERGDESNSKNERERGEEGGGEDDAKPAGGSAQLHCVYGCVCVCVCSRQTAKLTSSSQSFWRVTSSNYAVWLYVCVSVCRRGRGSKAAGKLHYYASVCSLHCSSNNNNNAHNKNKLQQNTQKQNTNVVEERTPPSSAAAEAIRKLQPAANSCEAVGRGSGTDRGSGSDSGCRRRV